MSRELDVDGPAAPPRRNGELVFSAPWETRVFGIAVALHRAGRFDWEEFRTRLIAEIAAWESSGREWSYYACWERALERLVRDIGLLSERELDARLEAFARRPAGHDHGDGSHHHDHDHPEDSR